MDIAKDIVDKYSIEEIVDYLDRVTAGVLKNYNTAIKVNQPQILFSCTGDLAQIHSILREMKKRNDAREAAKQQV